MAEPDRTPREDDDRRRGPREGGRPSSGGAPRGDRPRSGKKPYGDRREGGKPRTDRREGGKPYGDRRDGGKSYGDRRESGKPRTDRREGGKPYGDRRDGAKPYGDRREGGRPHGPRDGSRPYVKKDRVERDGPPRIPDPELPEEITPRDLHPSARNELKTLSKENAERVARHLAMAARLVDDDPALAHEHALAATRHAGRIAVVRETAAITAYATGDFALALRELRTYRRISGKDDQIALMVDSERGVGRPDRALEVGRAVDRSSLPVGARVELAIAMSGARLDLGETERALLELDIPELDPQRAFVWSPALFAARATVLSELGRDDEAAQWQRRADEAAEALDAAAGYAESELLEVDEIEVEDDDEHDDEEHDDEDQDAIREDGGSEASVDSTDSSDEEQTD